jgi:hypothetical protein
MTSFQAISEYRLFACYVPKNTSTAFLKRPQESIDFFHINLLNGYGLAFLIYMTCCLCGSSAVAIKSLHFERMIAASVFLDVREPRLHETTFFKLSAAGIFVITASMAVLSGIINATFNKSDAINEIGQIFVVLISLLCGVRLLYNHFTDSAKLGLFPRHVFEDRSPQTVAKLSQMPIISISQLQLVSRAFLAAARIAQTSIESSKSSTAALMMRMGSVTHVFAASASITQHSVDLMESAAYPGGRYSFALWSSRRLPLLW